MNRKYNKRKEKFPQIIAIQYSIKTNMRMTTEKKRKILLRNQQYKSKITFSPSNHSYVQREDYLDLIYRVSSTLKWQSECSLLMTESISGKRLGKRQIIY